MFSGQGTQWPGMALDLLAQEPVFRQTLEQCDTLLQTHASWSLIEALTADEAHSRLDQTEVTQPVLFALQVALARLLASWGVQPGTVVGHSAGEVAAAHVAGVLSLAEGMRVAYERGRVMQQATGGGSMAAVGL